MCLKIVCFFLLWCGSNAENKRNVLLIVADDGGFEMGTYLNKIVQTPNLDALAKKSLIFNNAYTSVSSCSPSRSAILTGMPAHQNGMYGLHQAENHFNSLDKIKSLPNILRNHAIRTGIIGKKHVGPPNVYSFDCEQTEENNSINQVGRNITHIKLLVREFLRNSSQQPFFLYVAFHDPHRCGHTNPEFGEFCEKFGNGEEGMGSIPDWQPIHYVPEQIELPYFIPDTLEARRDVAAQYITISRLDQGVGLVLKELQDAGFDDSTLVIYTSDNGTPFPNGRTNLYDSGIAEPMFISSPEQAQRRGKVTYSLSSLLDITPTILDWFHITSNDENIGENSVSLDDRHFVKLTGKSLLPLLINEPSNKSNEAIFASHNLHEVTMYYPMRAVRTQRYKLIHNLNNAAGFPIDQDFYLSPTFLNLLNNTRNNQPTSWFKTLKDYYFRPEWELFDLKMDPEEKQNLASKPSMKKTREALSARLIQWQKDTNDPWLCAPHGVYEDKGIFKNNPTCLPLYNLDTVVS